MTEPEQKKARTLQSHGWVFTINNPTLEDEEAVKAMADFAKYIVCGKETGAQNGTPHLQGYVYLHKLASRKSISRVLPRARCDPARGSDFDNFGYSGKQDLWFKHGKPPNQGGRTDIHEMEGCTSMREIVMQATSVQAILLAQKRLEFTEPKRDFLPNVIWLYGGSEAGKTKSVFDAFGYDVVHKQDTFKWWQGYDGHDVVVIDDLRADFCKYHELLTLLDRYPYVVEQKGGSRQLRARTMFVTSCYSPWEVYKGKTTEDLKQLIRRIKYICHVQPDSTFVFIQNPYRKSFFVK